ncbi:hypothetical protein PENARI_c033G04441 [Penicillium arizonense]|uniref:Uncharacterized protein n=1 Tax=Penicillium arizonense TaxID=1835702 RepID=A0A1F5L4C6_PENAI|nr:hypothetical protein PENARI_c033G04441 [Penicillium arizonense]OGE48052.1 hypothetical protein PENARI_c033G04441 [Penicillium arizonense]
MSDAAAMDRGGNERNTRVTTRGTLNLMSETLSTSYGDDPTEWMMQVEDTLELMILGDLINLSLPRPEIDDPSYCRWSYWSASVGRWIGLQVDKDTRTRLAGLAEGPKMADVLFDELVSYTRGGERSDNLMIDIYKLADMKREHFSSAEVYITSYQRQISILRHVKLAPLPFHAVAIML